MARFQLKQTAQEIQESLDNVAGLNEFASQLGNRITEGRWVTTYKTVDEDFFANSSGPLYNIVGQNGTEYKDGTLDQYGRSSTFSGWMGYIGTPEKIEYIKVPGRLAWPTNTSAGDPPTHIRITLYRVPKFEEIKDKLTEKGLPERLWLNLKVKEETHKLNSPLTHQWEWQTVKFDTPFINEQKDMLMLCYEYNSICSACSIRISAVGSSIDTAEEAERNRVKYPAGWNTFSWYKTSGKIPGSSYAIHPTRLTSSIQNNDVDSLYIIPCIVGVLDNTSIFYNVNTEEGGNFYNKVNEVLNNKGVESTTEAEIMLAKSYDLVEGDTFQLFFRSIIKCFGDYTRFGIDCRCSKGNFYPDYFEYTPTSNDDRTYKLTIRLRDFKGRCIAEKETTLNIHKVPTLSTPVTKNLCVFGDSLTSSGAWAAEGIRRLVGTSDTVSGPASLKLSNLTIETFGTNKNTINTQLIKHEGYGGWTWSSFLTNNQSADSTDGAIIITLSSPHDYEIDNVQKSIWTDNNGLKWELEDLISTTKIKFNRGEGNTGRRGDIKAPTSMVCASPSLTITPSSFEWESRNPFWNELTNEVDFINWAEEKGCPQIDIAACLLTWNGGGAADNSLGWSYDSKIKKHMSDAKILLNKLHSQYPNAKIICMGIQIPSLTGGCGSNYGAVGSYSDVWGTAFYAWDYNKQLEELCLSKEFKDFTYYVDTKGQFDTIHMMPTKEVTVNTRSNIKYALGSNGVHPSMDGYYQIGDAFFRKLVAILDEENK